MYYKKHKFLIHSDKGASTMKLMRKSLSNQIYTVLKKEILHGEIPFGSKLVNRQLQSRFDVSSSPVRDAINRLYLDGLVSSITQSGAVVVEFTLEFYTEVNEVLLCIAVAGVRLAGRKADRKEVVEELKAIIAEQEDCIGTELYYDKDYAFHKVFIDHSDNGRLKALFKQYNVLHEVLVRHFYNYSNQLAFGAQQESIEMHRRITEKFEVGHLRRAMNLMEEHYDNAGKIFQKMIAKNPAILEGEA